MTDPSATHGGVTADKARGNPALRMLGLPKKLPSRRWMIFFAVVGTWTSALVHDRYKKKQIQSQWANYVAHLADESLPSKSMPRRITILLAAPPHDGLRAAREHFHEYIKPILVAAAIDWEVIEGRREGEVRAGLAEKIRKMREEQGEPREQHADVTPEPADLVHGVRKNAGIEEYHGLKGDLIVGRHTWKEYVKGLHEGWLGSMDPPSPVTPADEGFDKGSVPSSMEQETPPTQQTLSEGPTTSGPEDNAAKGDIEGASKVEEPQEKAEKTEEKPGAKANLPPTPPYISPSSYPTSALASTCPETLDPSTTVPLPHILGFLQTPTRMYRFLRRRHLADSTGESIAALVLAAQTRPYHSPTDSARRGPTVLNTDTASPPEGRDPSSAAPWEQELVLAEAEAEWHKSAWAENKEGEERERAWKEKMVIDPRIGERMRTFELPEGTREKAEELAQKANSEREPVWRRAVKWVGFGPKEKGGWDMGLEGSEDD